LREGNAQLALPIYYINLATRPDRRQFMEDQLQALGLVANRVDAVTPSDIPAEVRAELCDRRRPSYRRENELACTFSHKKAWRAILEQGHEQAVVLEDDALLSPKLPAFLDSLSGVQFDVLRFEAAARKVRILPSTDVLPGGVQLRPFRSTLFGSSGYVITADTIRKIIDHPNVGRLPIDVALYDSFYEPSRRLRRLHSDPAFCVQVGSLPASGSVGRDDVGRNDMDDSGEVHLYAKEHPIRHALGKSLRGVYRGGLNALDHLLHLPKGLTSERVRFAED